MSQVAELPGRDHHHKPGSPPAVAAAGRRYRLALVLGCALAALALAACGQVMTRPTATPEPTATATATMAVALAAEPTPTPEPYTPAPTFTPTATPTPVIYLIQPGDNLYIIADRFGVDHDLLRDVNGIENERALQVDQPLVIPVGGITGPIEPTPTATPTPFPVNVENVYFYPSPLGEVSALGEVHNVSGTDLERVLVQITLFDGQDRPLSSASAYSALDVLAPGQRAPFVLHFPEVSRFATYQAEVLSAVPAYLGSIHRDLEPRGVAGEALPRSPLRLTGRIMNVGPEEAVGVVVVATAYDPLGRVVGMRSAVPQHNVVARGGETGFQIEIAPAGPVVTYTIQAQGRRLLPGASPSPQEDGAG